MREYATPLALTLPPSANIANDLVGHATVNPTRVLLSRCVDGTWIDVTAAEAHHLVQGVARGFLAAGIERGDRVALMSRTRFEWTILDYALWYVGAVPVPIYETSSIEQLQWILEDSRAVAAIGETAEHIARIRAAIDSGDAPACTQTWCIEDDCVQALSVAGADVQAHDLDVRRASVAGDDLATVIYTSGTTARPKGCCLTHANLSYEATVTTAELQPLFAGDAATLLFLPLAHVFARVIQVGAVRACIRLGHSSDVRHLLDDLATFQPTFILAVPRILEKIFNTASQQAVADGHGGVFQRGVEAAIAWSRATEQGSAPVSQRVRRAVYDRFVYAPLRRSFGGRCVYAISGGAPLGERLTHFYRGAGLPVLEGYGLTETSAALTLNTPEAAKVGTVGQPLPGTTLRVDEDGELLARGGQVMSAYWNNPDATAQAIDAQGWFHTGDIGEIDSDGFVRITGRMKEIIVTAGGKNLSPTVLEERIRSHPLVDHCMVIGEGRPFVAALITVDAQGLQSWREAHQSRDPLATLVRDPRLLADIQQAVDRANRAVSQAEAVRKFIVVPDSWTEEAGDLTASLKLRRTVIGSRYTDEIESLYAR